MLQKWTSRDSSNEKGQYQGLCDDLGTGYGMHSVEEKNVPQAESRNSPRLLSKTTLYVLLLGGLVLISGVVLAVVQTNAKSPSNASYHDSITSLKSKSKKEKKSGWCEDDKFVKHTLKTGVDAPLSDMFRDRRGQKKFEASDAAFVDGDIYTICDGSWSIQKVGMAMQRFDKDNVQYGSPFRRGDEEESGFEAIVYNPLHDTFFLVRESVKIDKTSVHGAMVGEGYHPIILEVKLNQTTHDYHVIHECPSDFVFEGDSKGFEGAAGVWDLYGNFYLLGLCEGNHCRENEAGKEKGNGRLVLLELEHNVPVGDVHSQGEGEGGNKNEDWSRPSPIVGEEGQRLNCIWRTRKVLPLPPSVHFQDYSAISMRPPVSDSNRTVEVSRFNGENIIIATPKASGGKNGAGSYRGGYDYSADAAAGTAAGSKNFKGPPQATAAAPPPDDASPNPNPNPTTPPVSAPDTAISYPTGPFSPSSSSSPSPSSSSSSSPLEWIGGTAVEEVRVAVASQEEGQVWVGSLTAIGVTSARRWVRANITSFDPSRLETGSSSSSSSSSDWPIVGAPPGAIPDGIAPGAGGAGGAGASMDATPTSGGATIQVDPATIAVDGTNGAGAAAAARAKAVADARRGIVDLVGWNGYLDGMGYGDSMIIIDVDTIAIVDPDEDKGKGTKGKKGKEVKGRERLPGGVYDLPPSDQCLIKYCNLEGIAWIDSYTLVGASDRMKSKGKQNFVCKEKDQSVHIFHFPY